MCGRFTLRAAPAELGRYFGLEVPFPLRPRYNIAPSQQVLVLRLGPDGNRQWAKLRWGLVPHWAEDPTALRVRLINARAETVHVKPAFRAAFRYRRCLVAADGFYEWKVSDSRHGKEPYFFRRPDERPFAIAGLWEHWQGADGTELETCTLITTEANTTVEQVHQRMPVILPPEVWEQWLTAPPEHAGQLRNLLVPCPDRWLVAHAVSTVVNHPGHDGPECVWPAC